MIKHSVKDELLHISIENMDFSYRIPLQKLGKLVKWKIGKYGTEGIEMENVSKWTLQLFSKKSIGDKYIEQFKSLVQEHAPGNSIDWNETILAVYVQLEYHRLKAEGEMEEMEIISTLEEKYKLP
ncbi:MAG: hypothetical protein P8P74_08615 [Crocinitomicaceae bacterium]|nr:hypothetical protein [Crocinitomicaceae bacterium]